jgi:hypothetical protein
MYFCRPKTAVLTLNSGIKLSDCGAEMLKTAFALNMLKVRSAAFSKQKLFKAHRIRPYM